MASRPRASRYRGPSRSRGNVRNVRVLSNPTRTRIHSAPTTSSDEHLDYISRCEKWCSESEHNLVVENIMSDLGEFQRMLKNEKISQTTMHRLIILFNQSNFTEDTVETVIAINDIFCIVINSKFVTSKENLLKFLTRIIDDLEEDRNIDSAMFILNNLVNMLRMFINKFPNEHNNYSHLISYLIDRIENGNFDNIITFYERETIYELNSQLEKITSDLVQLEKDPFDEFEDNYGQPFRKIDIYPNYQEIEFPSNTELKALIREGEYENIESYLDIHFKLLREDMVYPLKLAMNYFMELDENYANALFTYDHVQISGITTLRNHGLVYKITFIPYGIQNLKNYSWERSDRLKYGSLLCISKKNGEGFPTFKDPLWAVAINQEMESGNNQITIAFKNGFEENFDFNTDYFMIESRDIYFEAYSHTLSVLQDTYECTLPFIDILLNKTSACDPPEYIDENTILNLGDLAPYYESQVRVFGEWPDCVKLNDSQFRALKYAFSSRVALIQGPPGTGKTHVGLAIMKILLRTRDFQMNTEKPNHKLLESLCNQPIIILTQSNHVLDQFLELVLREDLNIIRIGSRSESEIIKPHSLSEIRKYFWRGENHPSSILSLRKAQIEVRKELERIEHLIEKYGRDLQMAKKNFKTILSEGHLKIVASKEHFDSLYATHQAGFKVVMSRRQSMCDIWLKELGVQCKLDVLLPKAIPVENNPFAIIAGKDLSIPDGKIIDKYLILKRRVEYLKLSEDNEIQDEIVIESDVSEQKSLETPNAARERKILEEASKKFKKAMKETIIEEELPQHILQATNLWILQQEDRQLLYKYWIKRMINVYGLVVKSYSDQYSSKMKQLEVINTAIDLHILKQATVVGMTTTGAARNSKLIRKLKPKIILVDEAGEVLEAHIITSLSKSVEHLIMIGDPQMLKPANAVSRLSNQYNLNLSLFERLIINDFRHATLTLQHRMRPEISSVMRLIYPMLVDNRVVMDYEHIRGVSTNMYFISHKVYEDPLIEDSTSRANIFEAKFVVELTLYLLKQGYKYEEITILTFYNGQKYLIEDLLAKRLRYNQIKVSTVDKFQGEENEIIILSIVRGNKENYIGHCCVDNRTCVAFSRARSGFYVIGNEKCFRIASKKTKSGLWKRILERFKNLHCIGSSLQLYCAKHGNICNVSSGQDFKNIDIKGCHKNCGKDSELHEMSQKCKKSLRCGHPCLGRIDEDCSKNVCTFYKTKQLSCGHELKFICSLNETDLLSMGCEEKCPSKLNCGHDCKGTCFLCCDGNHLECIQKCDRKLSCGHDCNDSCHFPYECPPCRKVVTYKCGHSIQTGLCGDERVLCMERCQWKCEHLSCTKKCHEICDRPRCNDQCSLKLKCGHNCMGMCGEICPPICRKCKSYDENFQVYFGDEQNAFANFIIIDCGHIFEVLGLDRYIKKSLKGMEFNKLPSCPKCSTLILKPYRYRSTVNRSIINTEEVKNKISHDTKEIVQQNWEKLCIFLTQNISYQQILEHLEKAPIFTNVEAMYKHTNLHILSELLKMLIGFFTYDYPLEVWTEDSPIMEFFHSEQLDFLLNVSPQDNTPGSPRNLKELLLIFRLCPLFTIFKLIDIENLEFWERKIFNDLKTKFELQTQSDDRNCDENFLCFSEAFLFRINNKYDLNFPTTKPESFRRKITDNAIGWGKCKNGHLHEIFSEKDPKICPECVSL